MTRKQLLAFRQGVILLALIFAGAVIAQPQLTIQAQGAPVLTILGTAGLIQEVQYASALSTASNQWQSLTSAVPSGNQWTAIDNTATGAVMRYYRASLFDATLVRTGAVQTLMPNNDFSLRYFPDETLTVIHSNDTYSFRALVAAGISSYLIQGSSVATVTNASLVLAKSSNTNDFDNGYAGISGAYYHSDSNLYAIYHAEDQQGLPAIGGGIPGFYASVGLAVSTNNGVSFQKLGQVITSQEPKSYESYPGQADRGAGEPYCTVSRDGNWLYAWYTEHSRVNNRGVQICLARCDITTNAPIPGRWQKYYNGGFTQPGLGGLDTPVMSAESFNNADAIEPYVEFSPYLGKYVMLFGLDCWKELTNATPTLSGIYVAYSDDGIAWSQPKQVIQDFAIAQTDKSVSWHAAVVWDSAERRTGMLVWSYSPKWGSNTAVGESPHFMVGQRVRFDKN